MMTMRLAAKTARLLLLLYVIAPVGMAQQSYRQKDEEKRDLYKDWLQKDVVYIISSQEKDVFRKLTTDEEKDRFIEQFWRSRDEDPVTASNEFRDEHYRRLAYANENFGAGKPGWKTDRGMIYIKFGPPDRRETNPTGTRYYRTRQELLASDSKYSAKHMTTLPFEVWEYRHIAHLGQEIRFEFVSKDGSPVYTLALSPEEKDALSFNTGSILPKEMDRDRGLRTFRASPLDKLEELAAANRPLPYKPRETFVSARVLFSEMPFQIKTNVVGSKESPMVELEVVIPHASLSFNRRIDHYRSEVEMEIFIRDIRKLVVSHRAEVLESRLPQAELAQGLRESSVFRTEFALPAGRYLFEVWIRDVLGDAASFDQVLVVVPGTHD